MKLLLHVSLFLSAFSFAMEPPAIGDPVPDAKVQDIKGTELNFSDLRSGQSTLLLVYRGGWCPYCTKHLAEVQTIEKELKDAGVQIFAASPDQPSHLMKTAKKKKLGYTLLSDSDMNLSSALGLVFQVDDEMMKMLKGYNIDIEAASGKTHRQLPVPAAILINSEGVIQYVHTDKDYTKRISTEALLAAVENL